MTSPYEQVPGTYAPPPGFVPPQPPAGAWSYPPVPYAPPVQLASPWVRLGASLLNGVLVVVTLGIGYLVWTLVLWGQGTNPGKKICGLRVVKADTGRVANFGDMFVRNLLLGGIVMWLLGTLTPGNPLPRRRPDDLR